MKTKKNYVKANLALREGECARCALCCKVFFRCPFLIDNTCKIYESRFEQCRAFPIDPRDIDLVTHMGGECGFGFGKKSR